MQALRARQLKVSKEKDRFPNQGGIHNVIPKVYPNFSPVPGDAQTLKELPPVQWLNPVVTLLFTALCLTAGFGLGLQKEHRAALLPRSHPRQGMSYPPRTIRFPPQLP